MSLLALLLSSATFAQSNEPVLPASTSSEELAALEAAKKLYDAKKAASDAATAAWNSKRAQTEAEVAAATAKVGSIAGQSEIKGAVQAGTTPPKAEALLLLTRATLDAGRLIAGRIAPDLRANPGRDVLVLTDRQELAVGDAVIFDLRASQLRESAIANRLRFSQCSPPQAEDSEGRARGLPVATAIGTAVDLASKLGSYFMTDYAYGQIEVDPSPELLAAAVVGSFSSWTAPSFVIPSHSLASDPTELLALLRPLHEEYLEAVANREIALRFADGHGDGNKTAAAACTAAAAAMQKTIANYDSLVSALIADTPGGEPLGVKVVRQKQIQRRLETGPLILLLTGRQAAAYYTKRNLWTFLGGMPLHAMGGTSTTYTLFDPKTGIVLETGAVAHHGVYRALNQVERLINAENRETAREPR